MFVFIVVSLSLSHKAFPRNWFLLTFVYIALVPVALAYGWLVSPRPIVGTNHSRPRMPPLLLVGVAAVLIIFGYMLFRSEIDAAFYPV
jgi:fatty acid desaturase